MSMLQPVNDVILVKPLNPNATTKSGLIKPSQSRGVPQDAEVLAVGQEIDFVQAGDQIKYAQYAGDDVEFNGEKLLFLLPKDIYAKVTK